MNQSCTCGRNYYHQLKKLILLFCVYQETQNHLPKRVKTIHFFKGGLHCAKFGHVLFGRPSGISLKNWAKHLKKVVFALTF